MSDLIDREKLRTWLEARQYVNPTAREDSWNQAMQTAIRGLDALDARPTAEARADVDGLVALHPAAIALAVWPSVTVDMDTPVGREVVRKGEVIKQRLLALLAGDKTEPCTCFSGAPENADFSLDTTPLGEHASWCALAGDKTEAPE